MTDNIETIWKNIVQDIYKNSVSSSLKAFIDLIKPKGIMDGIIYLEVPNDFTKSIIDQKIKDLILKSIHNLKNENIVNFYILINPDIQTKIFSSYINENKIEKKQAKKRNIEDELIEKENKGTFASNISTNQKYTFETFVIGASNRFAHAASLAVAEAPAKSYNPLFIYGESGLGKTHLLHAIGNHAKKIIKNIKIRYVSSEYFTNDFINSIASNKAIEFHKKYRTNDILLIDDIQFLQGKDSTVEAFFHTFNTLHEHQKQIVITSDVPPKKLIGFEDRLRSRFEWGLITDMQTPDVETRIAILRKKAQQEKIFVPDEVIEFIALHITNSIRELEGALIRVIAFASLNEQKITLELVSNVLEDIMSSPQTDVISYEDIIFETANYYKISIEEIYSPNRSQVIVKARQIAMYLCREMTNMSLPKIGQVFSGRDHTTVIYAHRKVEKIISLNKKVYQEITEIITKIKQNKAN